MGGVETGSPGVLSCCGCYFVFVVSVAAVLEFGAQSPRFHLDIHVGELQVPYSGYVGVVFVMSPHSFSHV